MPVAEVSASVRVRVPAKVNLHLAVGDLRPDGFHDLTTVFQAVSLYDELHVRAGDGVSMDIGGDTADGVPGGPENLAWRAAELLAERTATSADVAMWLEKSIPVAGGMAGGSADAAAALLACATLWRTGSSRTELAELAAELGSDVAFPLLGGTALGTGRGELLSPVLVTGTFHWVFALAAEGVSAGAAYRELDRLRESGAAPESIGNADHVLDALRAGDAHALAATLASDLEAAVLSLRPELRDVLDAGTAAGALAAIVSGSGPTCAFLCSDEDMAAGVAVELDDDALVTGTRVAVGPVSGAKVLL
jgi:4-diphosphocytidyl-2-C-methyl-D-erythritol kinase